MVATPESMSGERYLLAAGDYAAEIAQAGAAVRELTYQGRPLILSFGLDELRPQMRGAVMLPWPGRIRDGRYRFDGVERVLPLTEPATGTAIHGLIAFAPFTATRADPAAVDLTYRLLPSPGYEFTLDCRVSYSLTDSGLTVTVHTVNAGRTDAPYGVANHPYLVAGAGRVDDWTLEFTADQFLTSPEPRLLPAGPFPVAGSDVDFGTARPIGPTELNHSFVGVPHDRHGWSRLRLHASDGQGVTVGWDCAAAPWLQLYSYDIGGPAHRAGLAVEPMSCPPDAFNSGTDLVRLAPGRAHTFTMTIGAA